MPNSHLPPWTDSLDCALAVLDPDSLKVIESNRAFDQLQWLNPGNSEHLNLAQDLPQFKPHLMRKVLARGRPYRIETTGIENVQSNFNAIFSSIDEDTGEHKPILLQINVEPALQQYSSMIESYDKLFRSKSQALNNQNQQYKKEIALQSTFLSRISHELRTPLGVISGFAQLQRQLSKEDSQFWQNNEAILKAGNDLQVNVQRIIDFIALANQDFILDNSHCCLQDVLTRQLGAIKQKMDSMQIELIDNTGNAVVDVDPRRFDQIIHELLLNALKFNQTNGKIELSSTVKDNRLQLLISNTGPDIGDDFKDKLFVDFYRSGYADRNEIPGTGIGLLLNSAIARLMKGQLSYCGQYTPEQTQAPGCVFALELPLATLEH